MAISVTDTSIYKAGAKISSARFFDLELYLERLFTNPENKWFRPTNKDDQMFDICYDLEKCGLIAKRTIPVWKYGSFKGLIIEFFYNKNLILSI